MDERNNPSSQEYVNGEARGWLNSQCCDTCKVFKELCKCGKYDKDGNETHLAANRKKRSAPAENAPLMR